MLFRAICTASMVIGLAVSADAQGRRGAAKKPEMERFAADGTVLAIAPGKLKMRTNTNQDWLVFIDPKAKIHVVGTAEADFLKVGHSIRFTAAVDQRGRIHGRIGELTLFTPSQPTDWGFWPAAAGPPAGNGANNGLAKAAVPQNPAQAAGLFTIAGRITGYRKGKLTINARRAGFQIELSEKPKITVDFADYSVVRPGDKISVTKGQMPVGRMGLAKATELRIELAEPLTGPRKKPIRPKPTPKPSPPPSGRDPDKS